MNKYRLKICVWILFLFALNSNIFAQTFSHSDSGWVNIFNGKDWTGLFSRNWGGGINSPYFRPPGEPYKLLYTGTDSAVIRVSATTPGGNIGTDKNTYSHYRMRIEQKFDALNPENNGGLTYHTDETKARMNDNWPRSIEFQMQQKEPGSAYSIQQLTFTTRVTGTYYSPLSVDTVNVCQNGGCNARQFYGKPVLPEAGPDGKPRWLRFELVVRGSDSAIHIINDTVVFKLWKMRIFAAGDGTPNGPVDHGSFGIQSEGAMINYRRWEVMEFPAGTPMSEHYLHRLFLDNPKSNETVTANTSFTIHWRTIGSTGPTGTVPKVNLDYAIGAGAWQSIGKDIANTGSYNWTVPNITTSGLRVKVSAAPWVWADSSGESTTGMSNRKGSTKGLGFIVQGLHGKSRLVFSDIRENSKVEIHDIFGKLIREIKVGSDTKSWDLKNSNGLKVQSGLYFLNLRSANDFRIEKVFIF